MAYSEEVREKAIELFKSGRSAKSILDALNEEYLHAPQEVPQSEKTIYRWCKGEASQRVRYEHFAMLRKIAQSMLSGGLDSVINDGTVFYKFGPDGVGTVFYDEFPNMILANIKLACSIHGEYDAKECFLPHLLAEFNSKNQALEDFLWEHGYSVLDAIRALAKGKTPKGVCPICKDWK
ncbi:hypothetical protein ACFLVY_00005 [Chloroflexota bacterium]